MSKSIELKIRSDVPRDAQCSHGKLWTEPCQDCRVVSLSESLAWMEPQVQRNRAELEALLAAGAEPWFPGRRYIK